MVGRVLIADDHPLCCDGLEAVVRSCCDVDAVDRAASFSELNDVLDERRTYALAFVDLTFHDSEGFDALMAVRRSSPSTPTLVVSAAVDGVVVRRARELGAAGFLPKTMPLRSMIQPIRDVLAGRPWFPPSADEPAADTGAASLTPAQLRVLRAAADGKLNKQIAYELNVTEATVKAHMTAAMKKLGVSNRTQAVLALKRLNG